MFSVFSGKEDTHETHEKTRKFFIIFNKKRFSI